MKQKKPKVIYCEDCGIGPITKDNPTPTGFQCPDCAEDGGVWVGQGDQPFRRIR